MWLITLFRDGVEVLKARTHVGPDRIKCLIDWLNVDGQTYHAEEYVELTPMSRIELC
jgi:hypothetical protein